MKKAGYNMGIALLLLVLPVISAHGQFEGIVESNNLTVDESDAPQQFVMTIWVGKGMMRVHNTAVGTTPPSTIIYRNDKGVFWILNEEEKTYIEVLQTPEDKVEGRIPDSGEGPKPVLSKTGKTKKILGYTCSQYFLRREGEVTEIWGTKQLPGLLRALTSVTQSDGSEVWTDELARMEIYPLVAKIKVDGNVIESQEVTKIEKRKLPKDMFELPAGYKREVVRESLDQPQEKM